MRSVFPLVLAGAAAACPYADGDGQMDKTLTLADFGHRMNFEAVIAGETPVLTCGLAGLQLAEGSAPVDQTFSGIEALIAPTAAIKVTMPSGFPVSPKVYAHGACVSGAVVVHDGRVHVAGQVQGHAAVFSLPAMSGDVFYVWPVVATPDCPVTLTLQG